jgi:hypothetical protein
VEVRPENVGEELGAEQDQEIAKMMLMAHLDHGVLQELAGEPYHRSSLRLS